MRPRLARWIYTLGWSLVLPLVPLYLLWRSVRQPEYRHHWRERFFGLGAALGAGERDVYWLHAVSLGETRAALPLIEALAAAHPHARFLLTHMTPTGRAAGAEIAQRLPGRIVQRYLPYDVPSALRRFFRQARPRIGIVLETEIWPNLLAEARAAGVPMVLVNARLSERSLRKAQRWPALIGPAAACFARVAAQTAADRDRIAQVYGGPIDVLGNLKFDLAPAADQVERGRALRARFGARPVWLFASSRDGEEALVLDALKKMGSDPIFFAIFLIVPRHPQRFDEVARLIEARGWRCRRRSGSEWERAPEGDAVLLGDSMGEMALYCAAADVALIGGSLLPFGSQNLIEACAVGTPVVIGPSTFNFAQAAEDAIAADAAVQVKDVTEAVAVMGALTSDQPRLEAMRRAARAFAAAHRGATARTVALVEEVLCAPAVRGDAARSGSPAHVS
ncbi:MAG TPA: lipid IV(A) 3-deoxy-D-manno-octulosonic acid transferase [Burkholderiaceae bacterium]|nr:lipid IV(A) 3-deoxy-D-manno-octulosonic acid transferase [Burkholderiaceae bacterium]